MNIMQMRRGMGASGSPSIEILSLDGYAINTNGTLAANAAWSLHAIKVDAGNTYYIKSVWSAQHYYRGGYSPTFSSSTTITLEYDSSLQQISSKNFDFIFYATSDGYFIWQTVPNEITEESAIITPTIIPNVISGKAINTDGTIANNNDWEIDTFPIVAGKTYMIQIKWTTMHAIRGGFAQSSTPDFVTLSWSETLAQPKLTYYANSNGYFAFQNHIAHTIFKAITVLN